MRVHCPNNCHRRPNPGQVIKYGSYYRISDKRKVQRYQCTRCRMNFSQATGKLEFGQKKRQLNHPILKYYCSGVSQRRLARNLGTTQKTIARKLEYLALKARIHNHRYRKTRPIVLEFEFDDLETFEHTKLKPVSVAMAVESGTREILGFEVSKMPAKGLLAKKSVKKYGKRKDERREGRDRLFRKIKNCISESSVIRSDSNPHYPESVREHFPGATHIKVEGQRGAVTGQGELKKIKHDPIFSLNHTYAMNRYCLSRLVRKTWCTTKKIFALNDHLELYMYYHNHIHLKEITGKAA